MSLFICVVVRVGFAMAGYTFSESTSEAMVVLRASNPVASQFTVRVQGGETRITIDAIKCMLNCSQVLELNHPV